MVSFVGCSVVWLSVGALQYRNRAAIMSTMTAMAMTAHIRFWLVFLMLCRIVFEYLGGEYIVVAFGVL